MIAENIKRLRMKNGLSQKHVAEKLGMSQQGYRQYEIGARHPKLETIKRIADALGVNLSELFAGTECGLVLPTWIPCSERLPEVKHFQYYIPKTDLDPEMEYYVSDWVLATTADEYEPICIAQAWHETKANEYGWKDASDHVYTLDEVLAWMPLPEPYKEENDDNSRETE